MRFRFRYLSPDGGELEVESLERLRALVQSGTVGEATLLFDALTSEWAPARAHAVFRLIQDGAAEARVGRRPDPGPDDPEGLDVGMTMSMAAAEEPDADEAVRSMLRQRDTDDPVRTQSFNSWAAPVAPPTPAEPEPAPPAPEVVAAAQVGAVFPRSDAVDRRVPPLARPTPRPAPEGRSALPFDTVVALPEPAARAVPGPPIRPISPPVRWLGQVVRALDRVIGSWALPPAMVLGGVLGLMVLLFSAVSMGTVSDREAAVDEAGLALPAGPDVARLVGRFATAQASGFHSMVAGMDSLRRVHDVVNVPNVWLEGTYLADAPRYPEVKEFWSRYQVFLTDVQARDTALFRAGFLKELEGRDVLGAMMSMRLSQATRDFERTQDQRRAVYRRMEELAAASLELHALLVANADDIIYDPALQSGLSREPVVEAIAQDTLLRDRMWTLMERIFASLEWIGGDLGGSRDNVTDLLLQGVEASAH